MFQMIKRDFYSSGKYSLLIFLLIPFMYIIGAQYLFAYVYATFFFVFFTFNADFKNNVNNFFVSLPIDRRKMVASRYLFFIVSLLLILPFHFIIDLLAHYGLPYLDFGPLTGINIVFIIAIFWILIAISIPIYYCFKSIMVAVVTQIVSIVIGGIGIGLVNVSGFLDYQPYIISLLCAGFCLYGSYRLSVWLFERKDI